MHGNEYRLVPGQDSQPSLGKLKLSSLGIPAGSADPLVAASANRRFRRVDSAWWAATALSLLLMATASALLLDRAGALQPLLRGNSLPSLPDAGLSLEARESIWTSAEYESDRFARLMGVPVGDLSHRESEARKPERLLSGRISRP